MAKKKINLDETLKAATVPDRPDTYWKKFPKRVTARLRKQGLKSSAKSGQTKNNSKES